MIAAARYVAPPLTEEGAGDVIARLALGTIQEARAAARSSKMPLLRFATVSRRWRARGDRAATGRTRSRSTTDRAGRPRVVRDDPAGRAAAIEVLRAGGIVALPTDTVYGIAVALATPGGIERLFDVKQRPPDKAIALLLADAAQAGELGLVSPAAAALAAALWPGPPHPRPAGATRRGAAGRARRGHANRRGPAAGPPGATRPGRGRRAAPDDVGEPLRPSRIRSMPPPWSRTLGGAVDLILDGGRTPGSRPSTVVDLTVQPAVVRRVGLIDEARIREVLAAAGLREPGRRGRADARRLASVGRYRRRSGRPAKEGAAR